MDMNEQNNRTALMNDTTKCLLKKIQTQIDKITFLHANPTQYSEIKKEIGKDMQKTMLESTRIVEKIIERMNKVNKQLNPIEDDVSVVGCVRSQMQYLYERRKKVFDEGKCCGILTSNRVDTMLSHGKAVIKGKGKTLSYEFKEKLIGFVQKRGSILWENERVDELVKSLMSE
ncbi:hypothetical protein OCOL_000225 [Ordospora colligata]